MLKREFFYISLGSVLGMIITELIFFVAHTFIEFHFTDDKAPIMFFTIFAVYNILVFIVCLIIYYEWNRLR